MAISAAAVKALRDRTGAGMMECKKALGEAEGDVERAIEVLRERGLAKGAKRAGRATSEGTIALAVGAGGGAIVEVGCETDFVAKTDDFQALAQGVADAALAESGADSPEALLAVGGLEQQIKAASGKLGENVVLKRCARLSPDGGGLAGGYVHAGGKLGVIVALETAASGDGPERLAKDIAMHVAAHDPSPVAINREGVPQDLVEKESEILRRQAEQEGKPPAVTEKIVQGRLKKFYGEVCLLEQSFVKNPDQSLSQLLDDAAKELGQAVKVSGFVRFKLGETATES
jgi:elongation factor Ts